MMPKTSATGAALTLVLLSAAPAAMQPAQKPYEAISLFGRRLASAAPAHTALAQYEQAKRDFAAQATEDTCIWLGRRTAYLGRYREAIAVYTEGLTTFPESYRLYRHRGHRYISIRQFGRAIADFEKAAALVRGKPLEVEPDGAPNKAGVPVSNTQFNIYYHLGLAYYLTRDFPKAEAAYRECLRWSTNDDSVIAVTDWLYMTLRRTGQGAKAAAALEPVRPGLPLLENGAYLDRLLMFRGETSEADFARQRPEDTPPEQAIRAYGLGMASLWRGDTERARTLFTQLVSTTAWASFATIAAEVELADLVRAAPECAEVGSALAAWSLAWNTRDLDLMRTLFASGHPPTYAASGMSGRIEGVEPVTAHLRTLGFVAGGTASDVRFWLEDLDIQHRQNIATVTGAWHVDRDVASATSAQRGPVSFFMTNTADGWRVSLAQFVTEPPVR